MNRKRHDVARDFPSNAPNNAPAPNRRPRFPLGGAAANAA